MAGAGPLGYCLLLGNSEAQKAYEHKVSCDEVPIPDIHPGDTRWVRGELQG